MNTYKNFAGYSIRDIRFSKSMMFCCFSRLDFTSVVSRVYSKLRFIPTGQTLLYLAWHVEQRFPTSGPRYILKCYSFQYLRKTLLRNLVDFLFIWFFHIF